MKRAPAIGTCIVPAQARHVAFLARRLRVIDRIECEAMGRSAKQALRHGLAASARCWTALVDDEPHAMFGVVVESALSGEAIPWFLGTDRVRDYGRALLAEGPALLDDMHRFGRRLRNFVSSDNEQAIRLLERWGFTVEQEQIVMRSIAFRRFTREIA